MGTSTKNGGDERKNHPSMDNRWEFHGISWDNRGFSIGLTWGSPSWTMGFLWMMVVQELIGDS